MKARLACWYTRRLILPYLEGALPRSRRSAVSRHLTDCVDCRQELRTLQQITGSIRQAVPPARDPGVDLWERLEPRLRAVPTPAARRRRSPILAGGLTAAMAAAAILLAAGYALLPSRSGPGFPSEISARGHRQGATIALLPATGSKKSTPKVAVFGLARSEQGQNNRTPVSGMIASHSRVRAMAPAGTRLAHSNAVAIAALPSTARNTGTFTVARHPFFFGNIKSGAMAAGAPARNRKAAVSPAAAAVDRLNLVSEPLRDSNGANLARAVRPQLSPQDMVGQKMPEPSIVASRPIDEVEFPVFAAANAVLEPQPPLPVPVPISASSAVKGIVRLVVRAGDSIRAMKQQNGLGLVAQQSGAIGDLSASGVSSPSADTASGSGAFFSRVQTLDSNGQPGAVSEMWGQEGKDEPLMVVQSEWNPEQEKTP